jgi:hypothetical protein
MTRAEATEMLRWAVAVHGNPRDRDVLVESAGMWLAGICELDRAECRRALVTHYRRHREPATPDLIRTEIRRNRIHRAIFGAADIGEWLIWPEDAELS